MADPHRKGLIVNVFHYFWPELLKVPRGFPTQIITPIVKVKTVYTIPECELWRNKNNQAKGLLSFPVPILDAEVYKGSKGVLWRSSEYPRTSFFNWGFPTADFVWNDDEENQKYIPSNRYGLGTFEPDKSLDFSTGPITYTDFVNTKNSCCWHAITTWTFAWLTALNPVSASLSLQHPNLTIGWRMADPPFVLRGEIGVTTVNNRSPPPLWGWLKTMLELPTWTHWAVW